MIELAKQRAERLMRELQSSPKTTYKQGEVMALLNFISQAPNSPQDSPECDTGCRAPIAVKQLQRGDVFIGKMQGGKVRPWITLRVDGQVVTAIALSSGDHAPNMMQAKCRLWPGNWIGATFSQFTLDVAASEVTRPYTDLDHLREIEVKAAAFMGLEIQPGQQSVPEIDQNRGQTDAP